MLIPLPPDYRPFLNQNLFLTPADVEVEEGYVEVVEGGREAAQSSEEALSVAKFHTCPACLGRGLCQVKDHSSTCWVLRCLLIYVRVSAQADRGKTTII